VADGLTLALQPPVRLLEAGGAIVGLEEPGRKRLRLPEAGPSREAFLRCLAGGASTAEALCGSPGSPDALALSYLLALLEQEGWLRYALTWEGRVLATLEPLTPAFRFQPAAGAGPWRLSRFAWLRRLEPEGLVLENPLGFGRVLCREPAVLAALGGLCQPRTLAGLAGLLEPAGLPPAMARPFLSLLVSSGAVAACAPDGRLPEEREPALRQWEFHDLLFHSRSRDGRHGEPAGGTLRFLGDLPPLPALKPAGPGPGLPLPGPDPDAPDPPFFGVLAARRSRREPGPEPITLAQLGTFLHHVARVRAVAPVDPEAGRVYETVAGPCPGGGGLHELELYLSVARCVGLAPGFYHYAAGSHALEPWPGAAPAPARLLAQAQAAMGAAAPPDLLFTVAARVQRVAWKYQTLAYALILKNTGVLYQQMYLVATALGLGPCGIGSGDTELFAQASGLDPAVETSVGEFALSGPGRGTEDGATAR